MSGARFGEVDLDLLADYVGGALDGTAEAGAVAGRIAADPAWERAHADLTAALAAVETDLATFAVTTVPMPADVAARIDAALAGAAPAAPLDTTVAERSGATAAGPGDPAGGGGRPSLSVLPGGRVDDRAGRGGRTGQTGRSRRWSRWGGGAAAAAALVAVVGLGVNTLVTGSANNETASTTGGAAAPNPYRADGGAQGQEDAAGSGSSAGSQVVASGTDYRRDTLAKAASLQAAPQQAVAGTDGVPTPTRVRVPPRPQDVPPALVRLSTPVELERCLAAIAAAYARPPSRVQVADLSAFEGRPAVVAVLVGGDGERVAWVSGPECGTPAAGADTIYTSAVR